MWLEIYESSGLASERLGDRDIRLVAVGESGYSILSANHRANGAREYIGLARSDEWMSCWGSPSD